MSLSAPPARTEVLERDRNGSLTGRVAAVWIKWLAEFTQQFNDAAAILQILDESAQFDVAGGPAPQHFLLLDGTRRPAAPLPDALFHARTRPPADPSPLDVRCRNTADISGLFESNRNWLRSSDATVLFDHYADAGNVTTGETDIYSDSLAGGQLQHDGDKIVASYTGIATFSATSTRDFRMYFGGTKILDTGALAITGSNAVWHIDVEVIRESSSVVRCFVSIDTSSAALSIFPAYNRVTGLTLADAQILKITGQSAGVGAATDDIVAKMGTVFYQKAA